MIRGLTELGVGTFIPLITERGQRMPRLDRCERAVIEACKQCGRAERMVIAQPHNLTEALKAVPNQVWVVLDPTSMNWR